MYGNVGRGRKGGEVRTESAETYLYEPRRKHQKRQEDERRDLWVCTGCCDGEEEMGGESDDDLETCFDCTESVRAERSGQTDQPTQISSSKSAAAAAVTSSTSQPV